MEANKSMLNIPNLRANGLQQQNRNVSNKQISMNTSLLILLMWVVCSSMFVQAQGTHYMDILAKKVFTDPLEHCDFFFQGHDKIPPSFSFNETGTNISAFAPKVLHKEGNVVKSAIMYDRNCLLLSSNGPVRPRHFSCKKAFSIRNGRLTSKAGPKQYKELFRDVSSLQVLLPLQHIELAKSTTSTTGPINTHIPSIGRDLNRRVLEERRCLTFYLHRYPEMQTGLALDLLELLPGLFNPDMKHKKKLHDLHTSATHVEFDLGTLAGKLLEFP